MLYGIRFVLASLVFALTAVPVASLAAPPLQHDSSLELVDFDSVVTAAPSYSVEAASYLTANGISISSLTAGTSLRIINDLGYYNGAAVRAPSSPNTLTQTGSNAPVQFTLRFSTPLDFFSFKRSSLIAGPSGVTHPPWSATAFNAAGAQIGSVSEARIASFKAVPAANFTLTGPGIASVRFNSDNQGTGFSAVVLDDFVLSPPPVPAVTSFLATPATITSGKSSILSWTTSNASTISISGVAGTLPPNGSVSVSPSVTTTYTLTAIGSGGTAAATTTVAVNQPPTRVRAVRPPSLVIGTMTQTISIATGGTINLTSGGSVTFDPNAISQNAQVTVELLNQSELSPANQNFTPVGRALRVTLSSGTLTGAMTFRIPFAPAANYSKIIGSVASSSTFIPATTTIDQTNKIVTIRFDASKASFVANSRAAQGVFAQVAQYGSLALTGDFIHNSEGLRRFDGTNWVPVDPAMLTGLAGKKVIIAVHGMLNDLHEAYRDCESKLAPDTNTVILGFQYDFTNPIHTSADSFIAALRALNFNNPGIKVNIMAHSEGTLVSAGAILDSTFDSYRSMINAFYPISGMPAGTPVANSNTAMFKALFNSSTHRVLHTFGAFLLPASDVFDSLPPGITDMGTGPSSYVARYLMNANRNATIPVVAYGHSGDDLVPQSSWSAWPTYFQNTTTIVDNSAPHDVVCSDVADIVSRIQTPQKPLAAITSFTAKPAMIMPGELSTLQWTTSNAATATLTGFGPVELTGSRSVMPATTTTYTLAATGNGGMTTGTATVTVASACSSQQFAGGNAPETRTIEMGKSAGSFLFEYDTFTVPDEMIVTYEGRTLYDTGCIGASGSVILAYAGSSTKIVVQVKPNCAGDTSTGWTFTVSCPL